LRAFDPGDPSCGTVKRDGKLPVLPIRDIGLCACSSLALSRLLAICGLLFFKGLISEDPPPGAEVEVPLGAEALEPLPGFGKDADVKRYTEQHKDTQRHIEQQPGHNATRRHTSPP